MFMNWSGGKVFENSKIVFDGVFLSIYSHRVKKLKLSKLRRKQGQKVVHKNASQGCNLIKRLWRFKKSHNLSIT